MFQILDRSRNSHEKRNARTKVRDCALNFGGGALVASAYLGDQNVPWLGSVIEDPQAIHRPAFMRVFSHFSKMLQHGLPFVGQGRDDESLWA